MSIIYSTLLKANYLAGDSLIFPILVRAACAYQQVPYSQTVVEYAATRPAILGALEMTDENILDDVLNGFARDPDAAGIMDTLILTAVAEYKQKEEALNGNN